MHPSAEAARDSMTSNIGAYAAGHFAFCGISHITSPDPFSEHRGECSLRFVERLIATGGANSPWRQMTLSEIPRFARGRDEAFSCSRATSVVKARPRKEFCDSIDDGRTFSQVWHELCDLRSALSARRSDRQTIKNDGGGIMRGKVGTAVTTGVALMLGMFVTADAASV